MELEKFVNKRLGSGKLKVHVFVVPVARDQLLPALLEGRADIAAALDDQVVMLSIHLHRHGFNRLIWFKDLDLLIRRYGDELDWGLILAEAKAEGAESSLWYTFRLLDKLLGTPLPNGVTSWIVDTVCQS